MGGFPQNDVLCAPEDAGLQTKAADISSIPEDGECSASRGVSLRRFIMKRTTLLAAVLAQVMLTAGARLRRLPQLPRRSARDRQPQCEGNSRAPCRKDGAAGGGLPAVPHGPGRSVGISSCRPGLHGLPRRCAPKGPSPQSGRRFFPSFGGCLRRMPPEGCRTQPSSRRA